MKFLILSQYYPPETGAPQNRLSDLAQRIQHNGHEVVVFTAMPNYPKNEIFKEYKRKIFLAEEISGIKILRSWIYVGKSRSIVMRLLNYFSFVFTSFVFGIFKLSRQDFIICESPPLFLGLSAYALAKFKNAKLIFNVSDLWPESAEKLGVINNKTMLRWAENLELFLYKKSYVITGQTQGIVHNIKQRTQNKVVHWLPNGIAPEAAALEFTKGKWRKENNFNDDDFILAYAGIIGHAQGLETIIRAAELVKDKSRIKFLFVGDGPELDGLVKLKSELALQNIYFVPAVAKDKALEIVFNSDAAIIPLKKLDLFKGAIPSKIFECLLMQKPILLGVDGEAKELFILQANAGLFFEPENYFQLADCTLKLYNDKRMCMELGANGKKYVCENFARDKIATDFLEVLKPNDNR